MWLYDKTEYPALLEKAKKAITITMDGYPDKWKWANGWTQSFIVTTLALTRHKTSYWDATQRTNIGAGMEASWSLMLPGVAHDKWPEGGDFPDLVVWVSAEYYIFKYAMAIQSPARFPIGHAVFRLYGLGKSFDPWQDRWV